MPNGPEFSFRVLYALLFFTPKLLRVKAMRQHASIKKTSYDKRLLTLSGFIYMLLFLTLRCNLFSGRQVCPMPCN